MNKLKDIPMVTDKKLIESLFLSIKKYNTPRYTAFLKGDLEKNKVLSSNPIC
jgi:hypothetical protein